jgi:phosphatidylserine/phosphatidylglycerophosphate/cardiolipin synthase-like enzyme
MHHPGNITPKKFLSIPVFSPFVLIIALASGILAGCSLLTQSGESSPLPAPQIISPEVPQQEENPPAAAGLPLATVYFTDPYGSTGSHPDREVVAALDEAQDSIQVAMYNFTLDNVTDALLHAHQRGVTVQVVLDSNTIQSVQAHRLVEAGIPVVGDNRPESMHNKFLVIDQQQVWTGSLNMTYGGAYQDHNNIVRLVDPRINQDYSTEFLEMFEGGFFGADSPANTPFPSIVHEDTIVEVYFSPDDGVLDQIISLVRGAQESIDILAFSLTSDDLADALLDQSSQGVDVRAVFDAEQVDSNIGGKYQVLLDAGLDVRRDTLDGLMHHKVIVVDNQVVLFGSYNFSSNAEYKNDENVVIVYDASLAAQFTREFEQIYERSVP